MFEAMRRTRREFLKGAAAAGLGAALGGCFSLDTPSPRADTPWPDFRFAHFGDLRISGDDAAREESGGCTPPARAIEIARAVDDIEGLGFILFSGNMAASRDPRDLKALEDFLALLRRKWFAVPGPVETQAAESAGSPPMDKGRPGQERLFWEAEAARKAWIVGLGTVFRPDEADAGQADQIELLKEAIDSRPGELIIALTHVPPFCTPAGPPQEEGGQAAADGHLEQLRFVLEAGDNVKMVFSSNASADEVRSASGLHCISTRPAFQAGGGFREVRIRGTRARLIYHEIGPRGTANGSGHGPDRNLDLDLR